MRSRARMDENRPKGGRTPFVEVSTYFEVAVVRVRASRTIEHSNRLQELPPRFFPWDGLGYAGSENFSALGWCALEGYR